MTKMFRALLALTAVAAAATAQAAPVAVTNTNAANSAGVSPLALRDAIPMVKRVTSLPDNVFDLNAAADRLATSTPGPVVPGAMPTAASAFTQYLPSIDPKTPLDAVMPDAVGTGGLQFTSTRMYGKKWWKVWPTTAVGRLLFKIGSSTYTCTGQVIRPGLVLTAGHCVSDGVGNFYTDFTFYPGYNDGGSKRVWSSWAVATTTGAWFNGGGGVPNTRDFALIAFNPDAKGNLLSKYTGYYGYQTNAAIGRHLSVLGYPCNLDSCERLHMVSSMGTDYGSLNNVTWGSDMRGGSSGGAVMKNFRVPYTDSTVPPTDNNQNIALSVVSWGYVSDTVEVQGGSILDSGFTDLMTYTCSITPWAC